MNKHYIRLDSDAYIIYGFSDAFEFPLETDICISENNSRHFMIDDEINPSLFNKNGQPKYKYVDDEIKLNEKPLSENKKMKSIRDKRDELLTNSDYIITRHYEESQLFQLGYITKITLTDEKYNNWLKYRQDLRDLPKKIDINNPVFPTIPE